MTTTREPAQCKRNGLCSIPYYALCAVYSLLGIYFIIFYSRTAVLLQTHQYYLQRGYNNDLYIVTPAGLAMRRSIIMPPGPSYKVSPALQGLTITALHFRPFRHCKAFWRFPTPDLGNSKLGILGGPDNLPSVLTLCCL